MRVLSTNISQPRSIEFHGKQFNTGIFKTPHAEALSLHSLGIKGDTVCDLKNHGGKHKAVYGFSFAHYDYWREALGKPTLSAGAFGENLTMSSLDEADVCIGDQLQIGSAILEVSQPRVPCFKLGVALGDPRAPALFTRHQHTGVYFRVLGPGEVRNGDEAEIVHRQDAAVSVHKLFRACFDRSFKEAPAILSAAARMHQLAPEWQEKVSAALAKNQP
jgi:MOSC domain-containing protein YiiM